MRQGTREYLEGFLKDCPPCNFMGNELRALVHVIRAVVEEMLYYTEEKAKPASGKALMDMLKDQPIWDHEVAKTKAELKQCRAAYASLFEDHARLMKQERANEHIKNELRDCLKRAAQLTEDKAALVKDLEAKYQEIVHLREIVGEKNAEIGTLRQRLGDQGKTLDLLRRGRLGDPLLDAAVKEKDAEIEHLRGCVQFHEGDARHLKLRLEEAGRALAQMREVITLTSTDKLNERIAFLERARKSACGHLEKVLKVDGGQRVVDDARTWLHSAEANA